MHTASKIFKILHTNIFILKYIKFNITKMTQKFTLRSLPGFLAFGLIQISLISLSAAITIKPDLILKNSEFFCSALLFFSFMVFAINTMLFGSTIYHLFSKNKSNCINTEKEKNPRHILLSFFQVFLGLTFSISGISLSFLIFFNKIDDKKIMLFGRIFCGIFASAMILAIVLSISSTIIGYFYSKNLIKNNVQFDQIKENKLLKNLNFLQNIGNILLSMNIYSCHLFINVEKLQANKIYFHESKIKILKNKEKNHAIQDLLTNEDKKELITKYSNISEATKHICSKNISFFVDYNGENYYINIINVNFSETITDANINNLIKKTFIESNMKNIQIYKNDNQIYNNNEIIHERPKITFNSLGLFIPQLTLQT
jgi:hypothetical protein